MYSVPHSEQLSIFLSSLGVGFILGVLYDVLRGIRLSFSKSKVLVVIFDLIYFILLAFITFIFILAVNKGEIRFYIILGEIIGLLFYYVSFGIAAIKITDKIIGLLRRFYSFAFKVLSAPFRLMKRLFLKLSEKIKRIFKKTSKNSEKIRKKHLPKLHLYVYNLFGILLANRKFQKKGGGSLGKGEKSEKEN